MTRHAGTTRIIKEAYEVLAEYNPMTARQVFYQLVSRQAIENTESRYNAVWRALVAARKEGIIPWEWMEDRLRRPREVEMWDDLSDFADMARDAYRRDVWQSQPHYFECWLEKDALSGLFQEELSPYGVTLNVGRGYDGWDSIHKAALRWEGRGRVTALYFGDFDPSGEDMVRSLRQRLSFFCDPDIIKCALTLDDINRYNLPFNPAKTTDTRAAAFIAKHGNVCVEIDALPIKVLRERIVAEVNSRMDLIALEDVRQREAADQSKLYEALRGLRTEGEL